MRGNKLSTPIAGNQWIISNSRGKKKEEKKKKKGNISMEFRSKYEKNNPHTKKKKKKKKKNLKTEITKLCI